MPTWRLKYEARPWTLNAERASKSHFTIRKFTRDWRQAFCALAKAKKIPKLKSMRVEAQQVVPNWRSCPDTAACVGAVKAAIDGIVDAGILPGDSRQFVTYVGFPAPIIGKKDALILSITGEPIGK